jgi:lipopolysaccharide export system protein LptC
MNRPSPSTRTVNSGAQDWTASSRSDFDRLFRNAARHSTSVRVLRIAVPGTALAICTVLALASWFNPLRMMKVPVGMNSIGLSGTKITMELPRLAGFTRDDRAYVLTAHTADQDLARPDMVELKGIEARMQLQDKTTVEMTAATGLYNTKAQEVTLGENVLLKSSSGFEAHLTDAVVDMRSGHIVSRRPVEVRMPNGVVNAQGIEVIDNGELVRFGGGVDVVMGLSNGAPRPKDGEPAP